MPTTHYSTETAGVLDGTEPPSLADPSLVGAVVHRLRATIEYDGQASGDDIVLGDLPEGAVLDRVTMKASATAGATATIALGWAGATGAIRSAATFTTANSEVEVALPAAIKTALTEKKRLLATIAAAALPTSANYLVVNVYYTLPEGG
jgi:hypothetical protein